MATDWKDNDLDNMFSDDEDDDLQPSKPSQTYYPIRPEGPIIGGLWDNGRWVHVGKKRKRFDDDNNFDTHSNLLINPKKRARFMMKIEQSEIEHLSSKVKRTKPPRHLNPIALLEAHDLKTKYDTNNNNNNNNATVDYPERMSSALNLLSLTGNFKVSKLFSELPISEYTKWSLKLNGFKYLTDIQRAAIPHALVGRDILGAAKTGSGKTLSFVIPIIDNLYRKSWNRSLGLGTLVLTPTRELALQIFKIIRLIGKKIRHLSCGLVVGGKHSRFEDEKHLIHKMSILVCTPGRILQHLSFGNNNFNTNQLRMLVIDEADLMLDIGLLDQVSKIIDYLPKKRQTMLFSATLTIDIIKLAKISLRRPVFLPIDTADGCALPKELIQTYVITPLQHKYNLLWSFIQTHINHKIIIFFATLRQVKFTRRIMLKLRPYSSIACLHSEMRQSKRIEMYNMFKRLKSRAILLCTEVASRGLDFGNIDWVINFDVPANVKSYIHRCGRTARLGQKGNSITFLTKNEINFINELKKCNIICKKLGVHTAKLKPIIGSFKTILLNDNKMMQLAIKSFNSYLAFYYFHGNNAYMNPNELDKDNLAQMFGLIHTPKYKKFLKKCKIYKFENIPNELKMLLLDNKKKKKQKNNLIKLMANDNINNNNKNKFENVDAPKWFTDTFKDRKDDNDNDDNKMNSNDDNQNDIDKWLEEEDDDDNEDDDLMKNRNNDDLELSALQAIMDRD